MSPRALWKGLPLSLLVTSSSVAAGAGAPAAAPPPAIVPTPARPTPAPELRELAALEGSWRCGGTTPAGPFGPEQSYKATLKVKKDLGDFWYAVDYEQKKTKHGPPPMTARGFLGYDTAAKKFVRTGADSMGGGVSATATGWEGARLVFTGELAAMGQRFPFRETYTKKGEREIGVVGELKMGKDWIALGNDDCRR
jgi:hypothetical protein